MTRKAAGFLGVSRPAGRVRRAMIRKMRALLKFLLLLLVVGLAVGLAGAWVWAGRPKGPRSTSASRRSSLGETAPST